MSAVISMDATRFPSGGSLDDAGRPLPSVREVTVVIVSWNAKDHLEKCLSSLRDHAADCVAETIVVDNASGDGSPDMVARMFPDVSLIRCGTNRGFAKANNLAFARVRSKYVALINSDVKIDPQCLQRLVSFLEGNADVAVVGPSVTGRDGRLQLTCRRLPNVWNTLCRLSALDRVFPHAAFFSGFELPAAMHRVRSEVAAIGGCCWVVRSEAMARVGTFDERFFFYAEDLDWCKRFAEGHWKIVFCPEATVTHYGGGSSENAPVSYSIEIIRSTLQYWRKHHGILGYAICYAMLVLHHAGRLALRLLRSVAASGRSASSAGKLAEDVACLRWLLMRREWSDDAAVAKR